MDSQWPDPLQLQDLKDAVDSREPFVDLDGIQFTIRYEKDRFYISPVQGFAPCGWFFYETAFTEIL